MSDVTAVTILNTALNVVQVCFLAWVAARYGRTNGNGPPGPKP